MLKLHWFYYWKFMSNFNIGILTLEECVKVSMLVNIYLKTLVSALELDIHSL